MSNRIFHGEFTSADASALSEPNSRFTLYEYGGTSTITLGATDTAVISDLTIVTGAALTVTVYDGADNTVDAGEVIARGNFPANGGETHKSGCPHSCQIGTYPKIKTSGAGQIDGVVRGYIQKAGG